MMCTHDAPFTFLTAFLANKYQVMLPAKKFMNQVNCVALWHVAYIIAPQQQQQQQQLLLDQLAAGSDSDEEPVQSSRHGAHVFRVGR